MASSTLPYRYLGSSGLKVSSIMLGTMTFGGISTQNCRPGQCDEDTAHTIIDRYVAMGGNFIDTADVYQRGEAEEIVGKWFSKHPEMRARVILATKVWGSMDDSDVNARGLSRHHIINAVDASLSRLETTYIDLYQLHAWDDGTSVDETLYALKDLVTCGKIRYIGLSNVTGWQFQKIVDRARAIGMQEIVSIQAQYSLLCRSTEWELLEVCKREGIAMLPWSPLKGGLLTGKFKRGEVPDSNTSRIGWVEANSSNRGNQSHPVFSQYSHKDSFWSLLDAMQDIATSEGASVPQVALAWLLAQPAVASIVIGAKTISQLEDNMKGAHLTLSPDQISLLSERSREPLPYPYELVFRLQKGRERK